MKKKNALKGETSPYLLQHAGNPVNWYPWSKKAFKKATDEDKPIFLSIGYSSCHWCHVMERESFENEEIAKYLNEFFVCIKVDREERPDVDDIYMRYVQLSTGQGGWPMSVFMRPDKIPFYAATYIPLDQFKYVLNNINRLWLQEREKIDNNCLQVSQVMESQADQEFKAPRFSLDKSTLLRAKPMLSQYFDFEWGGNQAKQKFPPHALLYYLVHFYDETEKEPTLKEMIRITLDMMKNGGFHDIAGGGFHRYATDHCWFLPHFEKMLYDNAQLAEIYTRAHELFPDHGYDMVVRRLFEWVEREMTSPDGSFYSALDADTEGEEGKYYTWSSSEVDDILGDRALAFKERFGFRDEGNHYDEASGEATGKNIIHLKSDFHDAADKNLSAEDISDFKALLEVRSKRVAPSLDDKILTSWNALMISAYAVAARVFEDEAYFDKAKRAADWFFENMRNKKGRLYATYNRKKAKLNAYLDDYSFLARAMLDLYDYQNDDSYLKRAVSLSSMIQKHFFDEENGSYYFTSDDHEKLIVRMKNPHDGALPSGIGVYSQVLCRLYKATGEEDYRSKAILLFKAYHPLLDYAAFQVESLLTGFKLFTDYCGDFPVYDLSEGYEEQSNIEFKIMMEKPEWKQGDQTRFKVLISIKNGLYIQSDQPFQAEFYPTRVGISNEGLATISDIQYPKPDLKNSQETGEIMKIFEGELEISASLEFHKNCHLNDLEIFIEYQVCTEKECFSPERTIFQV